MNNVVEFKSKREEMIDKHMELTIEIAHLARHIAEFQHQIYHFSVEIEQLEKILDLEEDDKKDLQ